MEVVLASSARLSTVRSPPCTDRESRTPASANDVAETLRIPRTSIPPPVRRGPGRWWPRIEASDLLPIR